MTIPYSPGNNTSRIESERKTHRHIILPLSRMPIKRPLLISGRNPIQGITHIRANIIIPVLIQRECAAGMLHEQIQHADFVVADLGQFGENVVGDQVGAAAAGGEGEVFLEPGRGHF